MENLFNLKNDYINLICDDSDIDNFFNSENSIVLYGGNGSGKTTLAKYLFEKYTDKFFYFNYEKSFDNKLINEDDENKIYISKGIKEISELHKKNNEIKEFFQREIYELILNKLNISTKSDANINLLKNNSQKIFFNSDFITNKNEKKFNIIKIDSLLINFKNYESETIKEIDENFLINHFKKYEKINLDIANDFLNKILKTIQNIIEKFSNFEENLKQIINEYVPLIDKKIEIYSIIENIDKLDKCLICNTKIENWLELKRKIKSEIDNYKEDLSKDNNIFDLNDSLSKLDNSELEPLKNIFLDELSKIDNNISIQIENKSIEKLQKKDYEKIKDFLFSFKEKINNSVLFIESYIINNILNKKNKGQSFINTYTENLKKIEKLEKEKKIFNEKIKSEFQLFLSFINEKIGHNRIKFTDDNKILIDNNESEISTSGDLNETKKLSEGEINFVIFCFSMIFYILENDEKIIILDDPFSSYDIGNELNIIYIICHFINSKKIRFIILSHSWNFLSCMYNNKILKTQPLFLYFRKNEKIEKKEFNILKFDNIFNKEILSILQKNNKCSLDVCFNNKDFVFLLKKMYEKYFESIWNEDEKCFFLFSIIPLVRSYLYTYKSIKKDELKMFHKISHYLNNDLVIEQKELEKIQKGFSIFLEDDNLMKNEKIVCCIKKIIDNKYFDEFLSNHKLKTFINDEKYEKNPLTKIALLLAIRKKIDYELFKVLNSDENENHESLIEKINYLEANKKITELNSMIFKSKRIIFNTFIHFERLNNYITPLIEINLNHIQKNYEEIKNILGTIKE